MPRKNAAKFLGYMEDPDVPLSPRARLPLRTQGNVTDFGGEKVGRYTVTAMWSMPSSYVSSTMYSLRVVMDDGKTYTRARSGGPSLSITAAKN